MLDQKNCGKVCDDRLRNSYDLLDQKFIHKNIELSGYNFRNQMATLFYRKHTNKQIEQCKTAHRKEQGLRERQIRARVQSHRTRHTIRQMDTKTIIVSTLSGLSQKEQKYTVMSHYALNRVCKNTLLIFLTHTGNKLRCGCMHLVDITMLIICD